MYTNMAHCAALYTNVMDKPDSDTPVLLLSYGQYPHLFFSRGITFAESLSLHTRRLKKLPPINRYYPLVPMLSSTSPSRSNSSTPAVNPLGVNYYDWGRRQPDRSPSAVFATLIPIHRSQKPHSRSPCLVPSSLVHGWISTS